MDAVLSTTAAVLEALRAGPAFGRQIIRTLRERGRGLVNPRPGTVYRALARLGRQGQVRGWEVAPGGARGARSRRYYELTAKGIAGAEAQRRALARLLTPPAGSPPDATEQLLMAERLRRSAEVSAFALKLQRGVRQATRRRA